MKLKALAVLSFLAVGLFAAQEARAETITVSSSTVTTIISGNSSRKHLKVFNNTASNVYLARTSTAATVAAGFILPSSSTLTLEDFSGTLYGLAPAGSSGADVRYITVPR